MSKIVGVKAIEVFTAEALTKKRLSNVGFTNWKRDTLFFDQILVWNIKNSLNFFHVLGWSDLVRELEFLIKNEIILDLYNSKTNSKFQSLNNEQKVELATALDLSELQNILSSEREMKEVLERIKSIVKSENINEIQKGLDKYLQIFLNTDPRTRSFSAIIGELENFTTIPILKNFESFDFPAKNHGLKQDIVKLVINAMPTPNEDVSWEQILDFKSDSDSRSKFLAIRNWINEVSISNLKLNEIQEKLEYLIDQYEKHMRFHNLKSKKGILEAIVITSAEIAENLAKLKVGELAKGLFSIKNKQLYLMEEEMKAPGREVAYISKARERFS
jgi:hypothetical protein